MWSDIRTNKMVDQIVAKFPDNDKNHLRPLCGLPVSSYFSALKIRWMIEHVPGVRKAMREKRCMFGTLDTWLVWVSCQNNKLETDKLPRTKKNFFYLSFVS